MASTKGLAENFDMASFCGVRVSLMRAMIAAGYNSPQELWDEICDIDWNVGGRDVYFLYKQQPHFIKAIHQKGRIDHGRNRSFHSENHNNYNFWIDVIASVLQVDADEIYGLSVDDLTHSPYFGYDVPSLEIEDADGFWGKYTAERDKTAAIIRSYDEEGRIMHEGEKRLWQVNTGFLAHEYNQTVQPDHEIEAAKRKKLATALARLGPDQAEIIRYSYGLGNYECLTCEQIADKLGQPIGTVKSRLSRGLDKLAMMDETVELIALIKNEDPEDVLDERRKEAEKYDDETKSAPPSLERKSLMPAAWSESIPA